MVARVSNHPKIAFAWNSGVEEFVGEASGKLKGVRLGVIGE